MFIQIVLLLIAVFNILSILTVQSCFELDDKGFPIEVEGKVLNTINFIQFCLVIIISYMFN